MDKKMRPHFSLKEKREIVLEVEKGGIAKKYDISPSTLFTFLKQKSKIEQDIDADALDPITEFKKNNKVQNIVYRYNAKFDILKNYRKPLAITVYHYFMYIYPNFPLI